MEIMRTVSFIAIIIMIIVLFVAAILLITDKIKPAKSTAIASFVMAGILTLTSLYAVIVGEHDSMMLTMRVASIAAWLFFASIEMYKLKKIGVADNTKDSSATEGDSPKLAATEK